jgi:hypothetical protein
MRKLIQCLKAGWLCWAGKDFVFFRSLERELKIARQALKLTPSERKQPMTLREIAEQWLKHNGFDGLFRDGCCSCVIGDIMPCDGPGTDCEAGYKGPCPGPDNCSLNGECAFHISAKNQADAH